MTRSTVVTALVGAAVGALVYFAARDIAVRERARCEALYTVAHTRTDSLVVANGAECSQYLRP